MREIDTHKNENEQIKLKRFYKELFEQQGKVIGQGAETEFDEKANNSQNMSTTKETSAHTLARRGTINK